MEKENLNTEIFWNCLILFFIEQDWGIVGFKNKEVKVIQIGTIECTAEE
jgi:hypothetical protein